MSWNSVKFLILYTYAHTHTHAHTHTLSHTYIHICTHIHTLKIGSTGHYIVHGHMSSMERSG